MALKFTDKDWFITVYDEKHSCYQTSVIRGPVATDVLRERVQRILSERGTQSAVLCFEDVRMIVIQDSWTEEELKTLRGECV